MEEKKICPFCGTEIDKEATRCFNCQNWLQEANENNAIYDNTKAPEFLATVLFAYFLGAFGLHRFFTGYIGIGIAQLLTFGGCGIWAFIDFLCICFNKYKDSQGRNLRDYDKNIGICIFVIGLIPILICFVLVVLMLLIALISIAAASTN